MKATETLIHEHEEIQTVLNVLERMCETMKKGHSIPLKQLRLVLKFFRVYVDELHHGKEEDLLIPALLAKGFPMKGGPMCTYFKSLQMEGKPLKEQIAELDVLLSEQNEKLDSPSPLAVYPIPIVEEHILGKKLLKVMLLEVEKGEQNKNFSSQTFVKLARRYIEFLREHIDKENRCLFPMSDNVFDSQEQKNLEIAYNHFDATFLERKDIPQLLTQIGELRIT